MDLKTFGVLAVGPMGGGIAQIGPWSAYRRLAGALGRRLGLGSGEIAWLNDQGLFA